jgi:hypothetical protein
MPFLGAFLIFVVLAAVTWAVGVALYQNWVGGPDIRQKQDYLGIATLAVVLVALASFIPHLAGYFVCLAIWWVAAKVLLELPWPRAVALFLILAALSVVSRLAVLGALEAFWPAPPAHGATSLPSPGPRAVAR